MTVYAQPDDQTTRILASRGESTGEVFALSRHFGSSDQALATGEMVVTYFTPLKSLTVSKIACASGATLSTGQDLIRLGLFAASEADVITLVAASASDTALFAAANTVYTKSFDTGGGLPASYRLEAGARYACGVLMVGSGTFGNVTGATASGAWSSSSRKMSGVVGSLADLPSTGQTPTASTKRVQFRLSA